MRYEQHEKFWKQERSHAVTTQCLGDVYRELESTYSEDCYFYSSVSMYVQRGSTVIEKCWETKIVSHWAENSHPMCLQNVPFDSNEQG